MVVQGLQTWQNESGEKKKKYQPTRQELKEKLERDGQIALDNARWDLKNSIKIDYIVWYWNREGGNTKKGCKRGL